MDGIFIGRFQPIHEGHIEAITKAASQVDTLHILVGSVNQCRSIKNPWTFEERSDMIETALSGVNITNYILVPINDYPYSDEQWVNDINLYLAYKSIENPILFGHMKEGNDYLTWFPDLKFKEVGSEYSINSTEIRRKLYDEDSELLPESVKADFSFYDKERILFKDYPFPETLNFNCADVVLECDGMVLLIKRKFAPGKDCWALPGGFKNNNETFIECGIRELYEETDIKVPKEYIMNSIKSTKLFDSPKRSFGIPRNTMAIHILIDSQSLPKATGSDDAAVCAWFPINYALDVLSMYDDHAAIIEHFTNVKTFLPFLEWDKWD